MRLTINNDRKKLEQKITFFNKIKKELKIN